MTNPIRFWSSVEYASIMRPIVRELNRLGYTAEHRFLIRSVDYRTASNRLARIWLRARMYLFYPLYFIAQEFRNPSSYCVICTNTFYAPFLSTLINRKHRRSIHLLYDLFPDALIASGKLASDSLIACFLHRIIDLTLKRSCANVILGRRLKQHIANRLLKSTPNEVIPVGTDCALFPPVHPTIMDTADPIKLLYCGNLGHLHDIDTLVSCMRSKRMEKLPISFRFCGNGAGMEQLRTAAEHYPAVSFSSGLKADEWVQAMIDHPVGIVTMRPGAETILLPSKTYSAMAAGQAILAICPRQSDLADLILKHDCGWVVAPGDTEALLDILESITADPNAIQSKRMNAQTAALKYYDARPVSNLWIKLFKRLERQTCPTL